MATGRNVQKIIVAEIWFDNIFGSSKLCIHFPKRTIRTEYKALMHSLVY